MTHTLECAVYSPRTSIRSIETAHSTGIKCSSCHDCSSHHHHLTQSSNRTYFKPDQLFLAFVSSTMRFIVLTLACLASLALAQTECGPPGCPDGPGNCGCSGGEGTTVCFCSDPGVNDSPSSICGDLGSCGCPADQNGRCISVCVLCPLRVE